MWNTDERASSLRQLHALNRHFISRLLAADECDVAVRWLPQQCIDQLRELDAPRLHELCATPYTLYHLPFGNATYWHETARLTERDGVAGSFVPCTHATLHLTELTVFLTWLVARTDAAGARLFFGVSSDTLEFFRRADVATLSRIVPETAQVLQPRWHDNPCFWPELIRSVGKDRIRLQNARLLGAQLLAAELYGKHVRPRLSRRRRAVLAPRARVDSAIAALPSDPPAPVAVPI